MQNIPVCSLVAWSGTGKTTFLEKLIPLLKKAGLKVAVVKHDAHDFEIDDPGKDSWRLSRAGADVTAVCSPQHAAVMENRPVDPVELVNRITGVDLILTEGFKNGMWPKIALWRGKQGDPFPTDPEKCLALIVDEPVSASCPCFSMEDAAGVAEFLLPWFKKM